MARKLYTEEFRVDAVKQVTKNGYSINDTAERLGVHPDSLRNWIRRLETPQAIEKHKILDSSNEEIKKLQKELKRVTEERDILKKAAVYFASHTN
jgi:transposase